MSFDYEIIFILSKKNQINKEVEQVANRNFEQKKKIVVKMGGGKAAPAEDKKEMVRAALAIAIAIARIIQYVSRRKEPHKGDDSNPRGRGY